MAEPTKQQLLEAAARVYSELGFRGATTRRIAEEAGVNEVTLFRLFGSKAALIHAAVHAQAHLGPRESLPEVPTDPVKELTEWAGRDHEFMIRYRDLLRTAMAEVNERPDCAFSTAEHSLCSLQELRAYIGRLAKHRFIPAASAADAGPASLMLVGTLFADAMGRDITPTVLPPLERAASTYVRLFLRSLGATVALALLLLLPTPARAQQPAASAEPVNLSLADALRLASDRSEAVRIAGAGVTRARGQQRQANSQLLPQLNGSASYQRALESQFQAISERFAPDTGSGGGGGDLANSPLAQIFAAPNTFVLQLNATQNVYTAGKVDLQTVALGLQRFNGIYYREPGLIQAGTLMTLVIPVVAFLIFQHFFTRGIVITGIEK